MPSRAVAVPLLLAGTITQASVSTMEWVVFCCVITHVGAERFELITFQGLSLLPLPLGYAPLRSERLALHASLKPL